MNINIEHTPNFEDDPAYQRLAEFQQLEDITDFKVFRHHGIVNDLLTFVFLIIRLVLLLEFSLWFIFDDHVRHQRIFQLMGVRFEFFNMARYIYKKYPVKWTFFMLFVWYVQENICAPNFVRCFEVSGTDAFLQVHYEKHR